MILDETTEGINEGTAQPGSVPGEEEVGATTAPAEADEVILGEDGKPAPFNNDPRFRDAMKAQRVLKEFLNENELEDPEDLRDLIRSGKTVMGKGLDESQLDDLITKATKMDQVEQYWAQLREAQKREEETPEETRTRILAQENENLRSQLAGKDAVDNSKKALENFEHLTSEAIDTVFKDASKEEVEALKFMMGVNHPFGEIDINNPAQVSKMAKEVKKVLAKHDERVSQQAIKDYVDGKIKIPKVGSASTATVHKEQGISGIKDARKITLAKLFSQQ